MAGQRQYLASVQRPAKAFAAFRQRGQLRGGRTNRRRNGIQGVRGSLAHQFETPAYLEFCEQGRNVELHSALGEVEFVRDFLIGQAAQDSIEDFFLAAREAHGAFCAVTRLQEFLRFFVEADQRFLRGRNHDEVIARRLPAHHAVHGEQASGMINGKFSGWSSIHLKMGRAGVLFVE